MADHAQQQILEAVQTALLGAATDAALSVYLDRVDELPQAQLPAIDILGAGDTGEESIEYITLNPPAVQQRSYTFAITSLIALSTGSAKASRNLAKQVEVALMATTLSVSGKPINLLLSESTEVKDPSASLALSAVRQVWQAQYHTAAGAPDVLL